METSSYWNFSKFSHIEEYRFNPNVAPGGAMIVPGWSFSGGFPTESMAQNTG
jgi:hypothetical protein